MAQLQIRNHRKRKKVRKKRHDNTLTNIELRDVECFTPLNHILPLNNELQAAGSRTGGDEFRAEKPGMKGESREKCV